MLSDAETEFFKKVHKLTSHEWSQIDNEYDFLDHSGWADAKNYNMNYFVKCIKWDEYVKRRDHSSVIPKQPSLAIKKTAGEWSKLDKVNTILDFDGWRTDFNDFYKVPITWAEYVNRRNKCTTLSRPRRIDLGALN